MGYQTSSRPLDPAELESDRRIREAKENLTDHVQELKQRFSSLKENLKPAELIHNPWVHVGGAFLLGFLLGRTRVARPLFGALFTAAATALVREAVTRQLSPRD